MMLVNPSCPINWKHPLNQGLIGEWSAVPNSGQRGGLTVRDMRRRYPSNATLVSQSSWLAGAANFGKRRGGYGALSFDGASTDASLSNSNFLSTLVGGNVNITLVG